MTNINKQKGFTLTELMVGVTIGLIGSIIIFQALQNSTGIVENVSSGNDANQNGAIAAYMIERDARIAGFGLNQQDLMTCTIQGTRVDPGTGTEMPISGISLNPAIITQGASGAPDRLVITYASSDNSFIAPAKITEAYPGDTTPIKVSNRYGFQNGGLFLISDGTTCTLRQIKELPSGGASDNIVHVQGTYKDQYNQDMPIKYNNAAGEGVLYPVNSRIYNVGGTPVSNEYSIQNNNLVVTNGFTGETSILVTDVLNFQVVYGMNVGGALNWTTTAPTTAAQFNDLSALKFAVLARSNTKNHQRDANNICTTTTVNPSWSGTSNGDTPENFNMTDADWRCYRYKVFESTAFLKNMVWRPT